jgi:hypothetical protein
MINSAKPTIFLRALNSSCAGLTRASIKKMKMRFTRWIAGSSPRLSGSFFAVQGARH